MHYKYRKSSEGGKSPKKESERSGVHPIDRCGHDMVAGRRGKATKISHLEKFVEKFHARFFHESAKREVKKFLELQQGHRIVDA